MAQKMCYVKPIVINGNFNFQKFKLLNFQNNIKNMFFGIISSAVLPIIFYEKIVVCTNKLTLYTIFRSYWGYFMTR